MSILLIPIKPFYGFSMEFHFPFYVLRRSQGAQRDQCTFFEQGRNRSLRQCERLPRELSDHEENEYIYEAQVSVLITGFDEWFWTAYCFVDTFFSSDEPAKFCHHHEVDAPTGGERWVSYPVWNPREYFLFIMARRFRQATKEWSIVVRTLDSRLQSSVIDISVISACFRSRSTRKQISSIRQPGNARLMTTRSLIALGVIRQLSKFFVSSSTLWL